MAVDYEVIVVGAGNAALCAAISAREQGAKVLVLERAPETSMGGNSHLTDGAIRFSHNGLDELRSVMPQIDDAEAAAVELEPYPSEAFEKDLFTISDGLSDPGLTKTLAYESFPTIQWMHGHGVKFELLYDQQAFKVGDKFRFWGGLATRTVGAGKGLVQTEMRTARELGVEIWYGARATRLLTDAGRVTGVTVERDGKVLELAAKAVVLASGGFEANPAWRARYLGKDWDLAVVRGTPYNTGDGLQMALDAGAQPYGHWSGCHAVASDVSSPRHGGDYSLGGDLFKKHSYPLGIMVNRDGRRFVDEGADYRNFTYAKYGRAVLEQPGRIAHQIFDTKVAGLLRREYFLEQATKVEADTVEELARSINVNAEAFLRTVESYNAAVQSGAFDPHLKDGKRTVGLEPEKTNWAQKIDTPPFYAFTVTAAITFTFGGVRIGLDAQVLDFNGKPIPGLFAAGEMVGGIFYYNYPGGSGLMSGAVFGRLAGRGAARSAQA